MIIRFSLFIIMLLSTISCAEDDNQPQVETDYMLFGHFYGFCLGEQCIEIFKLTDAQLFEDTIDQYPSRDKPYEGSYTVLDETKFDLVKGLAESIPDELLNEQSNVIGSPDASDGGGVYVAIISDGETRFWLIDQFQQNVPSYLRPFVTQINESIALINN